MLNTNIQTDELFLNVIRYIIELKLGRKKRESLEQTLQHLKYNF